MNLDERMFIHCSNISKKRSKFLNFHNSLSHYLQICCFFDVDYLLQDHIEIKNSKLNDNPSNLIKGLKLF